MNDTKTETVSCKVEGMSCNNCALTISQYLEKQGMQQVVVSFATGDVQFQNVQGLPTPQVLAGINKLGYHVLENNRGEERGSGLSILEWRLVISAFFTVPLLLHMLFSKTWFSSGYFQLILAVPVMVLGYLQFARNAWRSLLNGMANMDVLIVMGAGISFIYSILQLVMFPKSGHFYFETAASILTLVMLGNWLESKSVRQTTNAISELSKLQLTRAKLLKDPRTNEFTLVDNSLLGKGDSVLVNEGDSVPADGVVYWGTGYFDESMISGESAPVGKSAGDRLIGGSVIVQGSVKMEVSATGKETVLSHIIELVKESQANKPPIQRLADKISAIFVPAVILVSILTFGINHYLISHSLTTSIMRAIAVLVIACPCAMGLATPAAIMVGLGRAARSGILIKGTQTLETFKQIQQVVFDKTGTLTDGNLKISGYESVTGNDRLFQNIVANLEAHSSHPIAQSVLREWPIQEPISWVRINEVKGMGMEGVTEDGTVYKLGSRRYLKNEATDSDHQILVSRNGDLIGWLDMEDQLRPEAAKVIKSLHDHGIHTVLLSGDTCAKVEAIAKKLGIQEFYAEMDPIQKLEILDKLKVSRTTAMVGDGINDAPALVKADIGIALSDSSQVAIQSANVILLQGNLGHLPLALGLGVETFKTIRQNLFWAFLYNVIAIPLAASGFLSPIVSAASMGLSDVVLALNSLRLRYKKIW